MTLVRASLKLSFGSNRKWLSWRCRLCQHSSQYAYHFYAAVFVWADGLDESFASPSCPEYPDVSSKDRLPTCIVTRATQRHSTNSISQQHQRGRFQQRMDHLLPLIVTAAAPAIGLTAVAHLSRPSPHTSLLCCCYYCHSSPTAVTGGSPQQADNTVLPTGCYCSLHSVPLRGPP